MEFSMPNKVAVFLRGHKRTWDYIKHDVMPFYELLGNVVHYYVCVWQTGIDVNKLRNDFPSDRLKDFKVLGIHQNSYDPMFGPIYQTDHLMGKKYVEEFTTNEKYDLVVDTRFDNWFYDFDVNKYCREIGDYTHRLGAQAVEENHLSDHFFMSNGPVHVINNYRAIPSDATGENSHAVFLHYAQTYGLDPYTIPWFKTKIIRPNIIQFNKDEICSKNWQKIYAAMEAWNSELTLSEKNYFIEKSGCPLEEYEYHVTIYHHEDQG